MEPQASQPPQAQTPHNQVRTGRSRDPLKMSAIALLVLLLAFGGVAAWQMVQLNGQNSKVADLEKTVSDLQAAKTVLQTELDALKGIDTSGTETDPDTLKIMAATDAHMRAPTARSGLDYEYNILVNKDDFARVATNVAGVEGSGSELWLKKVGDNWAVIVAGQDGPTPEMIDLYGIPKSVSEWRP